METILRGIEYIENHLKEKIKIADVANYVGYSQFHYAHKFAKATHQSVYDYYMRRRISEAYKDLIESNNKIIEIALEYGFASPETFIRAFRRLYGVAPSEVKQLKKAKSLVSQKRIDQGYLREIQNLNVKDVNVQLGNQYFKGKPSGLDTLGDHLVVFDEEGYWTQDYALIGKMIKGKEQGYYLKNAMLFCHLSSNDITFCLAYVFTHYFDEFIEGRNQILLLQGNDGLQIGVA